MQSVVLPVALTSAAAAGILNIWLAVRVGKVRMAEHVLIGDGGNLTLTARMRAHANFVEFTPFVLLLIALIEFNHGSTLVLWGASAVYMVARILHALGMDMNKPNPMRAIGIILTILILLGLSAWAVAVAFDLL